MPNVEFDGAFTSTHQLPLCPGVTRVKSELPLSFQPLRSVSKPGLVTMFPAAAATVSVLVVVVVAPRSSVTYTVALNVPPAYVCVTLAPLWGPTVSDPSPKSNTYETTEPSRSVEALASSVTVSGAVPDDGVRLSAATGGAFPRIEVGRDPLSALNAGNVTLSGPVRP